MSVTTTMATRSHGRSSPECGDTVLAGAGRAQLDAADCATPRKKPRLAATATATAAASGGPTPRKQPRDALGPRKLSFGPAEPCSRTPHTLLLGTQPSDNSLRAGQYFMTNENAFWWIVGDALGFRRGEYTNDDNN